MSCAKTTRPTGSDGPSSARTARRWASDRRNTSLLLRKPADRPQARVCRRASGQEQGQYTRARWQVDAHAFWRSSGNRLLTAEELATLGPDKLAKAFTDHSLTAVYDYEQHVAIGEALEARSVAVHVHVAGAGIARSGRGTTWCACARSAGISLQGARAACLPSAARHR